MKQKKAWKKPEVQDLDVQNTASGNVTAPLELSFAAFS